jgi:hypothetical protein
LLVADGTTLAFTTESSVTRLLPDGSVTDAGEWKLWIQGPYRGASLIASGTTENGGAAPLAWARGAGSVVTARRR